MRTFELGNYFGISGSNLSHRNCKDFPDAFTQIPPQKRGKLVLHPNSSSSQRVVFKSVSNHTGDPSSEFHKRKIDFLNRNGISVPKSLMVYLASFNQKIQGISTIVSRTAKLFIGNQVRKNKKGSWPMFRISFPVPLVVQYEQKSASIVFLHILRVDGKKKDWFKPGETLMGYIEAVKNSTSST